MDTTSPLPFLQTYQGGFSNMLRWSQLDALWQILRQHADAGWYVYAIGETPPQAPLNGEELVLFLDKIDALLHREHNEDYCGIVYADQPSSPRLIKIYDPNNLGVVCGISSTITLPGWTISLDSPCDLHAALAPPQNRRRWWKNLWGNAQT
jgi:hypothetical protein